MYFDQWGQRDDQQALIGHLQRDPWLAQGHCGAPLPPG